MANMTIFKIGQQATLDRTFTDDDVRDYIDITGDTNPAFLTSSPVIAGKSLVPPTLLFMLLSSLLGTRLPGRGANWLRARVKYLKPVHINETISGTVEITQIRPEKHLVYLKGVFLRNGETVCDAEAMLLTKDVR